MQVIEQPSTFTVPADSGYGNLYGPEVPVGVNPDCDSAKVAAEVLNRALQDIYGQIDGYIVDMDITLENVAKKEELIGGLKSQIETLRAKVSLLIKEPPKEAPIPQKFLDERKALMKENAELRDNQEQHAWYELLGGAIAFILAGLGGGFLLGKLS